MKTIYEKWLKQLENNHGGNVFKPKNLKEINQEELANTNFVGYTADFEKYVYIKIGKSPVAYSGKVYLWRDGTGVFMHRTWKYDHYLGQKTPKGESNTMIVRFFSFGCDHDYEHTARLGNCYNEYKCKKCGDVKRVDSSD